ncbi:MAG TPA: deoxyribodipyrimidine photo-lyase [Candidatus Paceibacterota bacterium]|nr:deoxyribodipyrimidine photo-lyase [Candidatus Paceibacterota bacterium]HMO83219.1 deoxyribodipyrimidine photo-lyase [Candidatus Paceibacterota bacterium]
MSVKKPLVLYWARRDLRVLDNPALLAASTYCREINADFLPVYILEDYMVEAKPEFQFGYPSRWFLSQALPVFAKNFQQFLLVQAKAANYLTELSKKYQLTIFVNDDIYPDFYTQIDKLKSAGVVIHVEEDALSVGKETRSQEGNLYSVFTPFKKRVWTEFVQKKNQRKFIDKNISYLRAAELAKLPNQIKVNSDTIFSIFSNHRNLKVNKELIDLDLLVPKPALAGWYVSEAEALKRFSDYLKSGDLGNYDNNRNSLELDAENITDKYAYSGKTSKMSLALAWGLVSSRVLVGLLQKHFAEDFSNPESSRVDQGALVYISELIWREFYRYQLFHHPELMQIEFQKRFRDSISWVEPKVAKERFLAWIIGETGYPVVDAAMKQLATTGWMHNRARMIVASVLTKNLGVDWRWGQEYFRASLIDLDEASNNGGWQWGASVGADPKPIRIFNPELQAKNYDRSGAYRNKWLEENDAILLSPKVPIVEHRQAREEAMVRYGLGKRKSKNS